MNAHQLVLIAALLAALAAPASAQPKYLDSSGKVRVALSKQPLSPDGPPKGPTTMAEGGIDMDVLDRAR